MITPQEALIIDEIAAEAVREASKKITAILEEFDRDYPAFDFRFNGSTDGTWGVAPKGSFYWLAKYNIKNRIVEVAHGAESSLHAEVHLRRILESAGSVVP